MMSFINRIKNNYIKKALFKALYFMPFSFLIAASRSEEL